MSNYPAEYQYINAYNASIQPSSVHVKNTNLSRYFRRYLLQKAISVFKWALPDYWSEDYLLYVLYTQGYLAVINTNKYGVIPQNCGLYGFDIFYRPTHATIANPLLRGIIQPKIGTQCELLRLQPDYGGIMDIVNYYADMLALCSETAAVNILNSKLSYVFTASSKSAAESLKKMYDKISGGDPMVVADKALFTQDGKPEWLAFEQNVGANYITPHILSDMRSIEMMFDTDIGIPNSQTDKKANLIEAEVTANVVEVASKAELWLDQLQICCAKINNMFGLTLGVEWRHKPQIDNATSQDGEKNES